MTYTYSNIIIDPTKEGIENLIGKEVYISDVPKYCLCHANKNDSEYLAVLKAIRKDHVCPFLVKRQNINYEEAHSCIIVKKEPCYEDQVKQWIEENNLKVGDYVKVTRRAENHADGLDDYWYDLMRDSVGKILKVKEISNFIMLDNGINYPYFVLEKIEPPKPKYVPFESKEEFIRVFDNHTTNLDVVSTEYALLRYGMWIRGKHDKNLYQVISISKGGVFIGGIDYRIYWSYLHINFEFLDGSPCGKESKDV